ncbi:MAG: CotH kinase family protein [Bacteroidetes bacterium]|nr:CotH kinase family protein [Bacteroidota bacterium]HET6244271.1 CotH kinase family protein [Bacteroidia bacterium]
MKKYFFLLTFVLVLVIQKTLYSQVIINEISNANGSILMDESGENNDWIEIYNSSSLPVNLLNYTLSDNINKFDKWTFPDFIIEPLSYKIIFASGKDIKNGKYLHTNFKLKSTGEKIIFSDDDGNIVDNFEIGHLQYNHSSGRSPDGGTNLCLFNTPSPGATNTNSACYEGYEPEPAFSLNAGFYPSSQTIELYTPSPSGIVKYSVDGSFPSNSSSTYANPINANKTSIISSVCYSSGNRLPSKVIKRTYFIDENSFDLPVFSITMNPKDLFDNSTGIYMNFKQDWEKLCHVEYFDKQKVKQFELDAGIKIHGGFSRAKPQKSFRIKCRKKYGTSVLNFPLIPEKPKVTWFESFNLRNGGTDYNYTRFRDAFLQKVMKNENVGTMGYEPAIVFLNGEYWGEYEIREKQDEKYIESNYGVPAEKVDLLTHKGSIRVLSGSDTSFYSMHNYIKTTEAKSSTFYNNVGKMIDIENYVDYFIAEIYYHNNDWIKPSGGSNNIKLWHSQLPGGKWRYVFWDLDMTSGIFGISASSNNLSGIINPPNYNIHSEMFSSMLNNQEFKYYFVNRFADLMNTVFQYDSLIKVAYPMRDSISSSMQRHQERWGGSYNAWNNSVDNMLNWFSARGDHVRNHIQTEFNLVKQVELNLVVSPYNAGRIKINSIIPKSIPWNGVYYDGVPVTITAIPNPGFTFDYWGVNKNISSVDPNEKITLNISSDDIFTAYFKGSAIEPKITFSEINYHSAFENDAGDWLELHNYGELPVNLTGWYINNGNMANLYQIPFGTIIPPNGYAVFSCDTQKFVSQHPFVTIFTSQLPFNLSNSSETISLLDYDYKPVVSVTYSDASPWPNECDGKGRTLELKDPMESLDVGSNWFAGCFGGSPGVGYNAECLTGILEKVINNHFHLEIGPNPSDDLIVIKIILDKEILSDLSFSMYDFTGKEVKKIKSLENNELVLDRKDFVPGIYIVKTGNSTHFITEKIIFQ